MKTVAYVYSCRNPGQVALRWEWSTPPIGHGWLDVKRDPLVRLSDVEAEYMSLIPGTHYMDPPDGGDVPLIEQMRRMAQDAARYRWLCDENGYFTEEEMLCGHSNDKSEVDRRIDIAITTGVRP